MVAQLVELLLPTSEFSGSTLIIDINDKYSSNCNIEKTNRKVQEVRNVPSIKNVFDD